MAVSPRVSMYVQTTVSPLCAMPKSFRARSKSVMASIMIVMVVSMKTLRISVAVPKVPSARIGQTCQNGLCSGGSNGGSTDGGSNGGSIGSESTCADNFDCDFLEVCDPISRQCRPRGSGSGCVDDFDCDFFADEVCDLNTNQCVPNTMGSGSGNSCSSDFDCGLFEVCDNGMCIEGCISDFDCAPGETCSFSGLCKPDFRVLLLPFAMTLA